MKKMKMKMVKKIVSAAVCAVLLSGSVCQSSFPANAAAPEARAEINLPADSPTAPFTPLAVLSSFGGSAPMGWPGFRSMSVRIHF